MSTYRFLEFELSDADFCLSRSGARIALEPKAVRVLLLLIARAGRLVEKQELLGSVWPNTFVEENALTRTIGILRKELGDSPRDSKIIETVPTRGYRFIASVELLPEPDPTPTQTVTAQNPSQTLIPNPLSIRGRPLLAGLFAAFGIAAAIFLFSRPTHHDRPLRRLNEQRITSNSPEAPVDNALVSPDGKYLAYAVGNGLYLRVISSGETRRWNLPKEFIASPTGWFPDSTHLLVLRMEGMPPLPSLWKLSLLGGSPQKLIDKVGAGSVSPDGTRIVFQSFQPAWGRELWIMGADGSNPHRIAESSSPDSSMSLPAWSPNGRRIAYIERRKAGDPDPVKQVASIWTRDPDGEDAQAIVTDTWLGASITWSADGRIVFASRESSSGERDDEAVRFIRADENNGKATGAPQVVTEGAGIIDTISVSSDGRRLVLCRSKTQVQAFITEFDPHTRKWKTPQRLTLDVNGSLAEAWLPDSKTVLFVSNRNGKWSLFKQSMDETTAEVLVDGHHVFLPRLSADDTQVLYQSQALANHDVPISLMRLPITGGPPRLVLKDFGIQNHQCARPPSTLCVFSKAVGDRSVFISFDPIRGAQRELLRSNVMCNWSLSPDGRTLVIFTSDQSIRFFTLENEVARESNRVTLSSWWVENGDWSADGKGVLIPSVTQAGEPVILELDRSGKVSIVLKGSENISFAFLVPAPDGQHAILGASVPGDNNAWMVDDF